MHQKSLKALFHTPLLIRTSVASLQSLAIIIIIVIIIIIIIVTTIISIIIVIIIIIIIKQFHRKTLWNVIQKEISDFWLLLL